MKDWFETWVKAAALEIGVGRAGAATAHVISALEALAAERRRDAMTPPFEGPIETLRQPRSISHWGMF